MNILILSAGTRNKVVQAFKNALHGKGRVIATDCSNLAPAIYDADAYYIVPRITEEGYIDRILDICKKEQITGVFSLIDPELSLLAKEKDRFLEIGTTPVVSDYDLVEKCFNKYQFYKTLRKMKVPTGKCYTDMYKFLDDLDQAKILYPVFVKPVTGSASININDVRSDDEIAVLFARYDDLMIQEYMHGQEYGADVYLDLLTGKCTHIFLKKKIKMRAGETDKSVSVKIPELFDAIVSLTEKLGFRGMIDIDIFDVDGTWYFSEINPRFGGGYPHAYACGVDFASLLVRNLEGLSNEPAIGKYAENICMMKYNEVCIRDFDGKEIIP
ncbi:MAG: ATP-grasp domain-containing protein [Lachnospiraceae bacterium]|nr:ATP-grasp domain-containing protein [Lachnospiraceae bacterium]